MSLYSIVQRFPAADRSATTAAVTELLDDPALTRLAVEPDPTVAPDEGPDAFFSQVLSALLRRERLDVEVAYLSPRATRATGTYRLPHGAAARALAEHGTARELPLIRDDAARVLVGRARHTGADGAKLHGESIVDNDRLFDGEAIGVTIEPLLVEPGLRARLERRLIPGRWHIGRAAQTGGTNLVVECDGLPVSNVVKRSTFYRHHIDLRLVCP